MPRRPDPYLVDDDNPELTAEQIRAMRPASEVLPPDLYASLVADYEARQAARGGAARKTSTIKAPTLDSRHRGGDGRIQQKRSDTLNKNLSRPIPQFSPDTTLGEMRERTGQVGEDAVRRAAANSARHRRTAR